MAYYPPGSLYDKVSQQTGPTTLGQAIGLSGATPTRPPSTVPPAVPNGQATAEDRKRKLEEEERARILEEKRKAEEAINQAIEQARTKAEKKKKKVESSYAYDLLRRLGMGGAYVLDKVQGLEQGFKQPGVAIPKQINRSIREVGQTVSKAGSDIFNETARAGTTLRKKILGF